MARNRNRNGNKFNGSKSNLFASASAYNNPLLDSTCNIPFSVRVGDKVTFGNNYQALIPGIMQINVYPTIGYAAGVSSDPVNRAALDEYAYVVHKNSRNTLYEAPDLMMYYTIVSSMYAAYGWLKRIYGFARDFSSTNDYVPFLQIKAMGINDPNGFTGKNLARFRTFINYFGMNLQRYKVPAKFNLLNTWYQLFTNVYLDAENSAKAQRYVFSPAGFWKFEPYTDKKGGKLTFESVPTIDTLEQLESYVNMLLNSIEAEEDIGIMMGDVLKAYGEENCFNFTLLDDAEYSLDPVYDHNFLMAIENCDILYTMVGPEVTQVDGMIKFTPQCSTVYSRKGDSITHLLNADHVLTPEEVYAATALTVLVDADKNVVSMGSAVIRDIKLYTDPNGDTTDITIIESTPGDLNSAKSSIVAMHYLSKFSHYPRVCTIVNGKLYFPGDIDTYTNISSDVLKMIHTARNMAETGFGSQIYTRSTN